jgi:hypothetical protein
MLYHIMARRRVARIIAVPFAAVVAMLSGSDTWAQTVDDLPPPSEPLLAEPGDWAADFNDAQTACYNGSMGACDSIWLSQRVLIDTFLHKYGYTCGGRVDRRGVDHCTEIFPGHE